MDHAVADLLMLFLICFSEMEISLTELNADCVLKLLPWF